MPPVPEVISSEEMGELGVVHLHHEEAREWTLGLKQYHELLREGGIKSMVGGGVVEMSLGGEICQVNVENPTLVAGMNTSRFVSQFPANEGQVARFNRWVGGHYGLMGEFDEKFEALTIHEEGILNNKRRNVHIYTGDTEWCKGRRQEYGVMHFNHAVVRLLGGLYLADGSTYSSIRGGGERMFVVKGVSESDVIAAVPGYMLTDYGVHQSDGRYYPVYAGGLDKIADVIKEGQKAGLVTGVIGLKKPEAVELAMTNEAVAV